MSEDARPPLQEFYNVYAPARFPAAKTRRARQNIARRLKLPLIRAGNSTLIDPQAADDRLRELALHQEQPRRGPGMPRLIAR